MRLHLPAAVLALAVGAAPLTLGKLSKRVVNRTSEKLSSYFELLSPPIFEPVASFGSPTRFQHPTRVPERVCRLQRAVPRTKGNLLTLRSRTQAHHFPFPGLSLGGVPVGLDA